jgi:conjugal transfer pilus assembly protein TraB
MASFQLNEWVKSKQRRRLMSVVLGVSVVMIAIITLASGGKTQHKTVKKEMPDLVGIVDESFSEANTESALTRQSKLRRYHSKSNNQPSTHQTRHSF